MVYSLDYSFGLIPVKRLILPPNLEKFYEFRSILADRPSRKEGVAEGAPGPDGSLERVGGSRPLGKEENAPRPLGRAYPGPRPKKPRLPPFAAISVERWKRSTDFTAARKRSRVEARSVRPCTHKSRCLD